MYLWFLHVTNILFFLHSTTAPISHVCHFKTSLELYLLHPNKTLILSSEFLDRGKNPVMVHCAPDFIGVLPYLDCVNAVSRAFPHQQTYNSVCNCEQLLFVGINRSGFSQNISYPVPVQKYCSAVTNVYHFNPNSYTFPLSVFLSIFLKLPLFETPPTIVSDRGFDIRHSSLLKKKFHHEPIVSQSCTLDKSVTKRMSETSPLSHLTFTTSSFSL